jgi:hypothetical protein
MVNVLDELVAVRFDRRMTNGRTGPVLLAGELPDEQLIEVVAKFSHGAGIGAAGLTREALCAMLAADLALPVPSPFLVRVEPDFIASLQVANADVAALLASSLPIGFGSRKLPAGYSAWMAGRPIPKAMQQSAAEIFAFDLLIQNADRRPDNPNLQFRDDQFGIFDHELALVTEGVLFWKPPWEAGGLAMAGNKERHVLRAGLQGARPDFARLIGAWEAISDGRLNEYRAALPPEWNSAAGIAESALTFLGQLRDNVASAMQEVQRVLT